MMRMRPPNVRHRALTVVALLSALAACGGGGSSAGGSLPAPTASSTSAPQSYTLSAIAGVSGIASGSATAYANAAVTIAAEASSPTGVALKHRAADSQTPLVYFSITANAAAATVTAFSASLTLDSAPSGTISLSQWENGAWAGTGATVSVSGDNVSFSYTLSPAATAPVYFALYTGTALPTPSPTASASAPSPPTSSPTASPSGNATIAPNTCSQTPAPSETSSGTVSYAESGFFSALSSSSAGSQICASVWEPSSSLQSALVTAATNHAAVTVIYPVAEHSEDSADASALASIGARVIWEDDSDDGDPTPSPLPTGEFVQTATLPIHAKFALVDGVAYLDGHNWFTSDVILQDLNSADYAAIQTDLTTFPSSPPSVGATSLTTDKYSSLDAEAALITNANPGSGDTLDFMSEDFDDYGAPAEAVFAALLAAAKNGATVNVIVEGPITGSVAPYETCDLSILAYNGANTYVQTNGGSEKILLIASGSNVTSAWIGSSNMSDYDYIDWGMTIPTSNSTVIGQMQAYYSQLGTYASPSPAPAASPTCSP